MKKYIQNLRNIFLYISQFSIYYWGRKVNNMRLIGVCGGTTLEFLG